MNKILNDKLILTYEINLPRRYKENIIDEIVKNNKYKSNFSGYEKELELRKSLKFLFSKISNTHDLLYLLFTNQYMEISKKTGLDEGLSKGACEYTYKYFQFDYVSNIPQVIIDFKLNVILKFFVKIKFFLIFQYLQTFCTLTSSKFLYLVLY